MATPDNEASLRHAPRIARTILTSMYGDAVTAVRSGVTAIIPLSAGLYAIGFCVCLLHYHRRGVPLEALGHQQFVAAGVLYVVLTGVSFWLGTLYPMKSVWRGLLSVLGLAGFVFSQMLWGAGSHAAFRASSYVAGFSLMGWGFGAFVIFGVRRHLFRSKRGEIVAETRGSAELDPPYDAFGIMLLASVAVFAALVFPSVPQWLGGGEARRVHVMLSPELSDAERRQLRAGQDDCWFEVLSSRDILYVAVLDHADVRCEPAGNDWHSMIRAEPAPDKKTTFVAIPRSRASMIIYR